MYFDEIEYFSLMVFCFNRYGRHDVNKFDLVLCLVTRVKNVSTRERERLWLSNCPKSTNDRTADLSILLFAGNKKLRWDRALEPLALRLSLRVLIGTHSSTCTCIYILLRFECWCFLSRNDQL